MKIIFSEEGLNKNHTTLGELLVLLLINNKINIDTVVQSLVSKGYITNWGKPPQSFYDWCLMPKATDLITSIALDSEQIAPEERLNRLAEKLKEIFPRGKKDGTSLYWSEGKSLIVKRLKGFIKKYGEYTDDQIINATKKYVESFNGDYTFMRTLKYFIYKNVVNAGEIEYSSDLLNYIENAGQEDTIKNDWVSITV